MADTSHQRICTELRARLEHLTAFNPALKEATEDRERLKFLYDLVKIAIENDNFEPAPVNSPWIIQGVDIGTQILTTLAIIEPKFLPKCNGLDTNDVNTYLYGVSIGIRKQCVYLLLQNPAVGSEEHDNRLVEEIEGMDGKLIDASVLDAVALENYSAFKEFAHYALKILRNEMMSLLAVCPDHTGQHGGSDAGTCMPDGKRGDKQPRCGVTAILVHSADHYLYRVIKVPEYLIVHEDGNINSKNSEKLGILLGAIYSNAILDQYTYVHDQAWLQEAVENPNIEKGTRPSIGQKKTIQITEDDLDYADIVKQLIQERGTLETDKKKTKAQEEPKPYNKKHLKACDRLAALGRYELKMKAPDENPHWPKQRDLVLQAVRDGYIGKKPKPKQPRNPLTWEHDSDPQYYNLNKADNGPPAGDLPPNEFLEELVDSEEEDDWPIFAIFSRSPRRNSFGGKDSERLQKPKLLISAP